MTKDKARMTCRVFFDHDTRQSRRYRFRAVVVPLFFTRVVSPLGKFFVECPTKHSARGCLPSKSLWNELYRGWHSTKTLPNVFMASLCTFGTRQIAHVFIVQVGITNPYKYIGSRKSEILIFIILWTYDPLVPVHHSKQYWRDLLVPDIIQY